MIRQKMDSLSFELLSRMAHMMTHMTRMTQWLDSNDSLARWLAVCQDPYNTDKVSKSQRLFNVDLYAYLAIYRYG